MLNEAFVFPEGSQTILLLPVCLVFPKKHLTQLKVRVLYAFKEVTTLTIRTAWNCCWI